jgi:hypothetical protein
VGQRRIAKDGIPGRSLKLRIVHQQLQARIASGWGEDCGCLKQTVGYRVCEVSALDIPHCGQD